MYKLTDGTELTAEIKKAFKENETLAYITYEDKILAYDDYLTSVSMNEERFVPDEGFIGQAVEREITIKINNEDNQFNLENKEVEYYQGVKLNNGKIEYINFGKFIVLEPENNDTKETTEFIARDYMKKFNIPYVHTLGTNYTYLQLVESLCEQAGVELGSTSFRNSNKIIANNPFINNEQCRFVLKQVAKIAFSVAYIGQDNKLYIGFENKNTVDESITTDDYIELEDNDKIKPVTVVTLRSSEVPAEGYSLKDYDLINSSANYNMVDVIHEQRIVSGFTITPINGILNIKGKSADIINLIRISELGWKTTLKAGKPYTFIVNIDNVSNVNNRIEFSRNTHDNFYYVYLKNIGNNILNVTPTEDILLNNIDISIYLRTYMNSNIKIMIVEGTYTAENAPEFIKFEALGEHELVIEEDYFAYSEELRIDLIQAASALFGLTYSPIKVSLLGSVYLGFNDVIEVTNLKGEKFKTYCFNLNSEYKGTLYNDIESPALTNVEQEYEYEEEVDLARRRTFIEIDKANQKITASVERIDENEEAITLLELTSEGLKTQVSQKIGANEVISTINQSAEKILIKANRISIESTYFTLADNGVIHAKDLIIESPNIDVSQGNSSSGVNILGISPFIDFHLNSATNFTTRLIEYSSGFLVASDHDLQVVNRDNTAYRNIWVSRVLLDGNTIQVFQSNGEILLTSAAGVRVTNTNNTALLSLHSSRTYYDNDSVFIWQSGYYMLLSSPNGVSVVNENNSQFRNIQASDFVRSSSKRYKTNIKDMSEDTEDKLMKLRPVTFDYKKESKMTGKNVGGLIAEEVENVIKELVTYKNINGKNLADGIDYSKLVPYLLKGYQILFNKVKALEENLDNK